MTKPRMTDEALLRAVVREAENARVLSDAWRATRSAAEFVYDLRDARVWHVGHCADGSLTLSARGDRRLCAVDDALSARVKDAILRACREHVAASYESLTPRADAGDPNG